MTAGEDVGQRCVQYEKETSISGGVIIQDVQKQDQTYTRQMIFKAMKRHVQSEARLVNGIYDFNVLVEKLLIKWFFLTLLKRVLFKYLTVK